MKPIEVQNETEYPDQSAEVDFLYDKAQTRLEQRFKIVAIMGEYYVVTDSESDDRLAS